jgi:hypothetical protein
MNRQLCRRERARGEEAVSGSGGLSGGETEPFSPWLGRQAAGNAVARLCVRRGFFGKTTPKGERRESDGAGYRMRFLRRLLLAGLGCIALSVAVAIAFC